jgi:hypothetical protein
VTTLCYIEDPDALLNCNKPVFYRIAVQAYDELLDRL